MARSSDIAPDTSCEADTIDYAATPAAGNTAPHPARNIDPVCRDAIAAPLASFFRIDLGALFALLSRPGEMGHGMLPPCAGIENGAAPSVPPARTLRGHG
jgi:hypothetical protein